MGACRDGRLSVHAEMVGSTFAVCGCGLPHVRRTCCSSYHAWTLRRRNLPDSVREERVELPSWCMFACVLLGCARGHVPCRSRRVSTMWVRASLDAHHHQQQLAATSDVGRHAHEPRTTHKVLSRRTKEESFDPLEQCLLLSSVVAREACLVDLCCFANFFFARSARRLCTHVNHGIKRPACRSI